MTAAVGARRGAVALGVAAAVLGVATLWAGAAWLGRGGDRSGALVLGLAALPATLALVSGVTPPITLALIAVLAGSAWASASGFVPQHWPWDGVEHAALSLIWCRWSGELLGRRRLPPALNCRTAVAVAAACGVLWEVVEWACDLRFGTDFSLSATDTVRDLGVDLLGCLAGAAWLAWSLRRRADLGRRLP